MYVEATTIVASIIPIMVVVINFNFKKCFILFFHLHPSEFKKKLLKSFVKISSVRILICFLIMCCNSCLTLFPTTYSLFRCHGGVDSTNPLENPLRVVFVQNVFNPDKVIYNCRSHAKGESQEFKIEEIEEL